MILLSLNLDYFGFRVLKVKDPINCSFYKHVWKKHKKCMETNGQLAKACIERDMIKTKLTRAMPIT